MKFLDYVEVDYNSPRRDKELGAECWIARTSEVRPPKVGDLVGIGDGEIDGGGICIGRVLKVDPTVRQFSHSTQSGGNQVETFVYLWVAPIEFNIIDKGFWIPL